MDKARANTHPEKASHIFLLIPLSKKSSLKSTRQISQGTKNISALKSTLPKRMGWKKVIGRGETFTAN
jgi:hypothetical protein